MSDLRSCVLSCIEHERLEFALLELRTGGRYLRRLRGLRRAGQAEWDQRERVAVSRLVDHELGHGCGR